MLHLLRGELELAMAQLGCATLADIGPGIFLEKQLKKERLPRSL